jgi:hypothetical protein
MTMAEVRPDHVRAFVAKLTKAELSPSTVKAIYLTVSQVFVQAVGDHLIVRSPCFGIMLPKEPTTRTRISSRPGRSTIWRRP